MKVKATREGLLGHRLASGIVNTVHLPFVALPSTKALYRFVRVFNPANGKAALAMVLDVGPWNTHDDRYVLDGQRPQAETGTDHWGRTTNHAGIDLGERVWGELGMTDNTDVMWEFIE
jgi:hypothetical protein